MVEDKILFRVQHCCHNAVVVKKVAFYGVFLFQGKLRMLETLKMSHREDCSLYLHLQQTSFCKERLTVNAYRRVGCTILACEKKILVPSFNKFLSRVATVPLHGGFLEKKP